MLPGKKRDKESEGAGRLWSLFGPNILGRGKKPIKEEGKVWNLKDSSLRFLSAVDAPKELNELKRRRQPCRIEEGQASLPESIVLPKYGR